MLHQEYLRRALDVSLICAASPAAQSLDQVLWETSLCSSCGCTNPIAMAAIVSWVIASSGKEVLGGSRDDCACEKIPIAEGKQRTRPKRLHDSRNFCIALTGHVEDLVAPISRVWDFPN